MVLAPWTVHHGDALDVLRSLPSGSVDLVLTDPPYSSGGQYKGDRAASTTEKYTDNRFDGASSLAAFSGDNRDQRSHLIWCSLWLGEALRLARPGSICAMFTDWRQLPTATDALQCGGWVWRGIATWHKPAARPQQGRPVADCEFIVWGTAGPRPQGRGPGDPIGPRMYSGNAPSGDARVHQTQKPIELLREWCALAPVGGVVLDPFTGSGSTGAAALLTGRRFVGIELSDHYVEVARKHLTSIDSVGARASAVQPTLFAEAVAL